MSSLSQKFISNQKRNNETFPQKFMACREFTILLYSEHVKYRKHSNRRKNVCTHLINAQNSEVIVRGVNDVTM